MEFVLVACSVCFGNPVSPLTKGALAGVFFLMAVIGVVLGAIVAIAWVWARRARNLTETSGPQGY